MKGRIEKGERGEDTSEGSLLLYPFSKLTGGIISVWEAGVGVGWGRAKQR